MLLSLLIYQLRIQPLFGHHSPCSFFCLAFVFPSCELPYCFSVNAEENKKESVLRCSFADLSDFCLGELISILFFSFLQIKWHSLNLKVFLNKKLKCIYSFINICWMNAELKNYLLYSLKFKY